MLVISDTSPVVALARIGHIDLLKTIFGQIVIPKAVEQELKSAELRGLNLDGILKASWISVMPVRLSSELKYFMTILDPGESEALALALELKADFILIDEKAGRAVASRHNLRMIGVLGILLKAKSEGLIPEIRSLLDRLRTEAEFWIGEKTYRHLLSLAGEKPPA